MCVDCYDERPNCSTCRPESTYQHPYTSLEIGWYDIGNSKYLYKLDKGTPIRMTSDGLEPETYLERKKK